jgi:hypothetical protein
MVRPLGSLIMQSARRPAWPRQGRALAAALVALLLLAGAAAAGLI